LQIFKEPLTDSQLEAVVQAFGGRPAPGLARKASVHRQPSKELTFAVAQKVILALPHDQRAMRGLLNLNKMTANDRQSLMECATCMGKASQHLHKAADKHPRDDDLQNAVAHHDSGMYHMSKIDFKGRDPEGGMESRNVTTDATAPAMKVVTAHFQKEANDIGRAVRKQASLEAIDRTDQRRIGTVLPPAAVFKALAVEHANPIPGHPLEGLRDTDPSTANVQRLQNDPTTRPETVAYAAMMALKPTVLAQRPAR
jgi:hypothetical protein